MNTSKAPSKLGKKLLSDFSFTSSVQIAKIVLDLLLMAVLSRILSPGDYGVVAAATLFLSFCGLLREIGISATIIQMPKLSVDDQRTGLTLVMLMSFLIFAIAQLGAAAFADFINIPQSEEALRVLALMVPFQAISTVSNSVMMRDLRLKQLAAVEIVAHFVGYAVIGIAMAMTGFGYWALVGGMLGETIITSVATMVLSRTSLRPQINRAAARRLLGTGSGFALSRILNFFALRADVTIVGRYLDAANLGLYSRAYKLMSMPADLYSKVADRVVFPAMAKVQSDPVRLRAGYMRGITLTALLGLPLTVVFYILAPEIISLLLGRQWAAVIPVFSILAIGTYFRLSARVSGSFLRAKAAIPQMVSSQVLYLIMTVGGSLLSVQYGIVAVGGAVSVAIIGFYTCLTVQACILAGVSLPDVLRAHKHGFLLSLLCTMALLAVVMPMRALNIPDFLILAVAGVVLAVIGVALAMKRPESLLGPEGVGLAFHFYGALLKALEKIRRRQPA